MIYLINCKNCCKCYNVPSPSTIKEKINKMKKVIKINLNMKVYYEKKRLKTYVLRKELK
jgi:hypothetical protein